MSAPNQGNTVRAMLRASWDEHLWRMENDPLYRREQDRLRAKRLAAMEEMQRLCEKWGLDDD